MRDSSENKTQQLIALAKNGDKSALNQLCTVYGERIRWIIRFRMGKELRSKLESMDLVQDALMFALRDLGKFTYNSEGDFLRWLSKIAENRIRHKIEKLHAKKRDIRRELPLNNYGQTADGSFIKATGPLESTTPSVIVSRREELDKLEKAIDELKPEYREVIVLTKIEQLSYREIADRSGKSPDAIRMLVSRAMAVLAITFERI